MPRLPPRRSRPIPRSRRRARCRAQLRRRRRARSRPPSQRRRRWNPRGPGHGVRRRRDRPVCRRCRLATLESQGRSPTSSPASTATDEWQNAEATGRDAGQLHLSFYLGRLIDVHTASAEFVTPSGAASECRWPNCSGYTAGGERSSRRERQPGILGARAGRPGNRVLPRLDEHEGTVDERRHSRAARHNGHRRRGLLSSPRRNSCACSCVTRWTPDGHWQADRPSGVTTTHGAFGFGARLAGRHHAATPPPSHQETSSPSCTPAAPGPTRDRPTSAASSPPSCRPSCPASARRSTAAGAGRDLRDPVARPARHRLAAVPAEHLVDAPRPRDRAGDAPAAADPQRPDPRLAAHRRSSRRSSIGAIRASPVGSAASAWSWSSLLVALPHAAVHIYGTSAFSTFERVFSGAGGDAIGGPNDDPGSTARPDAAASASG